MANKSSDIRGNLRSIYKASDGFTGFMNSGYTLISIVLTFLMWRAALNQSWPDLSFSILPALAGFSLASFALIFTILTGKQIVALRQPHPDLNDISPLSKITGNIGRAVLLQILALAYALVYQSNPFKEIIERLQSDLAYNGQAIDFIAVSLSFLGVFLLSHSLMLVIATVFTVLKIIEIQSKA